jgi:DNA-binding MarR family transcriptional regulator
MNKTVDLVNEWAAFEEKHPGNSIGDFCRYYLIREREKGGSSRFLEGIVPPEKASLLTKLLVRIVRMQAVYLDMAIKETGIRQAEEFFFLSVIKNLKSPKKTEVIYHTVNELSTGLNILAGLIKQGFIREQKDEEDKRSKRVSLTPKGERALKSGYGRIHQVNEMMFFGMPDDDVSLCIQLLKNVEMKFSGKWLHHKGRPFDEVYKDVIENKSV